MTRHSTAGSSGGSSFSSLFETSRDLAGVFAGVGAALNGFPGTDSPTKILVKSMKYVFSHTFVAGCLYCSRRCCRRWFHWRFDWFRRRCPYHAFWRWLQSSGCLRFWCQMTRRFRARWFWTRCFQTGSFEPGSFVRSFIFEIQLIRFNQSWGGIWTSDRLQIKYRP